MSPRYPELAIFVLTDRQTDEQNRLLYARRVIIITIQTFSRFSGKGRRLAVSFQTPPSKSGDGLGTTVTPFAWLGRQL